MKKRGFFSILLVSLICTALLGALEYSIVNNQFRQLRATLFPQTTGTITHSEVTTHHPGRRRGSITYRPQIQYTYDVNGKIFYGHRYRYGDSSASASQWAQAAVNDNPVGATVPVFYNPKNPSDALLRPGITGEDLFNYLLLAPFNLLMIALWVEAFTAIRNRSQPLVAGGMKWTNDGHFIRVRLPRYSPFIYFLGVIGIGAAISLFVLAFSGVHPSLGAALFTWGIVLVPAIGVAAWARAKESRGDTDLVINKAARTVELPLTFGRKQRQTLPLSALSGISVERLISGYSKWGRPYYSYAVMLQQYGRTDEKLTNWQNQARAQSLATWLRERIPLGEPTVPPRKAKNEAPIIPTP